MTDIRSPWLLYVKGGLMLLVGLMASVLLLIDLPQFKTAILLALTVWGYCRAYYFAFYVIEHYIDPGYKYAGLLSFVQYTLAGKRPQRD